MNKNYYATYYEVERNHWWFKVRSRIILDQLQLIVGGQSARLKILNVGVATGQSTQMLQALGDVDSVEYDSDCCEFLQEELGINAIQASVTDLPFEDDTYDLVCAFDVIEHVQDHEKAVSEMKRVCKQDGSLIFTVPALMLLWGTHDIINMHQRRYTKSELKKLLLKKGLSISFISYFNFLLFPPILFVRLFSRLFFNSSENEAKSDFSISKSNGFLSPLFFETFNLETIFLKRRITLPLGVSIIAACEKK